MSTFHEVTYLHSTQINTSVDTTCSITHTPIMFVDGCKKLCREVCVHVHNEFTYGYFSLIT